MVVTDLTELPMNLATVIVSAVLAALLTWSAVRKLSHQPPVVDSYRRVGVPEDRLNVLAAILLTGAAGLLLGILWKPVGLAAATGVLCYFTLAVAAHVRARDTRRLPTPLTYAALAAAALVLRLATP